MTKFVSNFLCSIEHVSFLVKKRKSKTPAQDRLQKLVDKNTSAVIDSLKEVKSGSLPKIRKSTNNATIVKKVLFEVKRSHDEVDTPKLIAHKIGKSVTADEIPVLFPPKNPAQERLKTLQNNLSLNDSQSDHDATRVFGDSFGIESSKPAAAVASSSCENMDEEMDWEPCQDSNYTFQQLESMAVDVLTDSAYIIPDTNVFLDSLASIKTVIDKGELAKNCSFPCQTLCLEYVSVSFVLQSASTIF